MSLSEAKIKSEGVAKIIKKKKKSDLSKVYFCNETI